MLILQPVLLGLVSINFPLREYGEPLNQLCGSSKVEKQAQPHQQVNP